jgi:hypothetical protein
MKTIEIGRLLRASTTGCVIGCRVTQLEAPSLGGMVRIQLDQNMQVYGLIHDIHIDDDGLVRQLVTVENLSEEVIQDNRLNRNVPVEISVLFVGYQQGERIYHLLPPRPPLTLDAIYPCTNEELCAFTSAGRFGYLRPLLSSKELPLAEVLAAHFRQAVEAHQTAGQANWLERAVSEVITLLRDDYPVLNSVLSALAELEY